MAVRKKGRQATRGNDRAALPAWIWLGIGVVLGLALSALVLIKDWAPMLRNKNLPQPNPDATVPPSSEPAVADDGKVKQRKSYDFYQVLPEMEVVIPDAELSAKARAEQQARAAQPATPGGTEPAAQAGVRYMLQAGSYPDASSADEAKARLALLGFVAQVQPVTINGKTWNRVRLGPYPSASDLETAKRTLADNGINAIALKETGQ
ncbi:MAG TPA: SPOR domain-containing protein [Rhodanobacteraceae bacterium]|nr:SPOR domain-containing protein [Rhodanobacteraceae bacterium]